MSATLPIPGASPRAPAGPPHPGPGYPGPGYRLLAPPDPRGATLAVHLERYGPLPHHRDPTALVRAVEAAGVTGRGGAGFPMHRKLRTVGAAGGRRFAVANAAEGEPASSKDRVLLTRSPHLVLDGLQLAALAVGAERAYAYLHGNVVEPVRVALAERAAAGADPIPVEVVVAPARFLAGEESALAARITGGPAKPRFSPPRVFERGVRGRPTLVHNVETLAHAALVARHGPAWFRAAGTDAEPGTMLLTVSGAVPGPVVVEVPVGVPLVRALELAGWVGTPLSGVLLGGYHGTWLPPAALATRLCGAALAPRGASVGAGVVVALPRDRCGIVETARVARYLAEQSAGQCGPCVNGLPLIAQALSVLATPGHHHDVRAHLDRWCGLVDGRGACHHPDGLVRFVRSAFLVFAEELTRHGHGQCVAAGPPVLPVPQLRPDDRW